MYPPTSSRLPTSGGCETPETARCLWDTHRVSLAKRSRRLYPVLQRDRRSRSGPQKVAKRDDDDRRVLREAEAGSKNAHLARRHGVSEATLYNWKAKYGGLEVSEAMRLRALENENGRFKGLLADAMLDNADLKDLLSKKWCRLPPNGKRLRIFRPCLMSASGR